MAHSLAQGRYTTKMCIRDSSSDNDVKEMHRVLNLFVQFIEQDTSDSIIIAATNSGRPVSYTHLDVYKRQPLSFTVYRTKTQLKDCALAVKQ